MNQIRKPIVTDTSKQGRRNHLLDMQRAMVPMPKWLKPCLITFLIFYCLFVLIGGYNYGSDNVMNPVMTAAYCVYILVLLVPFLIRIPYIGVMHPLVFLSLIALLSLVIRDTPTVVMGPVYVTALLDYKLEKISLVRAYYYILQSLAVISMYAGFFLYKKFTIPILNCPSKSKNIFIVPIGFIISLLGLFMLIGLSGSMFNHMLNILAGRAISVYTSEVHGFGQYMILVGFSMSAILIWYASDIRAKYEPHFWIIFIGALAIAFLAGGRRSSVIIPIIMLFCVHIIINRKFNLLIVVILIMSFTGFLGMTGTWRMAAIKYGLTPEVKNIRISDSLAGGLEELRARTAASPAIPIIARVPKEIGLLWGETYLMDILRFVPRQIWHNKPIGIDTKTGITFWNTNTGKPPGGVAEAYWNFHIPGIIVVYFIYGMGLSYLMSFYLANHKNPAAIAIFVITLIQLNPSQTSITKWYLIIIPTIVLSIIGGYFKLKGYRRAEMFLNVRR